MSEFISETELMFQSQAIGLIYLGSKDDFNTVVESILQSQDQGAELVPVSGRYIAVSDGRELMTYTLTEDMLGIRFLYISGEDSLSGRTFHSAVISFIVSDNNQRRTISFFNKNSIDMPDNAQDVINSIIEGLKKSVKLSDADVKESVIVINKSEDNEEDDDEWI